MEVDFNFYDASAVRPAKSGEYLAVIVTPGCSPYIVTYDYSRKYDAFNTRDNDLSANHAITVDYWAPLPLWLNGLQKTSTAPGKEVNEELSQPLSFAE